jgi:hypothetical protein
MQISVNLCGGISIQHSEVNNMTEQKAKPSAKKVTAAKAGKVASGKQQASAAAAKTTTKKAAAAKPAVKTTTVKKPAAKKTATVAETRKTKSPPVKKAPEKKAPVTKAKPATPKKSAVKPTPEERYRMVETTAYFIAERNNFQGDSTEHWAAAELEIAAKLG